MVGSLGPQLLDQASPDMPYLDIGNGTESIFFFSALEKGWCSTWGAGHFSTFDGHEYNFKGMCNYIFTVTCGDDLPTTFSIQLRRDGDGNISRIIVELGASVVTVNKETISVRDIG